MNRPLSVADFAKAIDRSVPFVHNGLKIGKFEAIKIGGVWIFNDEEVDNFHRKPFRITRKELGQ